MSQVFSEVPPTEPHVVSRLMFEARSVGDELDAEIEVRPDLRAPAGVPLLGPLASFCDTMGGVVAAISTFPVAVATADLGIALDPGARPRAVRTRPQVLRRGRTNVVTEMELFDVDTGARVGWSTMTSAVLSADQPQIYDPRIVTQMMRTTYTPGDDFYAELGLRRGPDLGRDGAVGAQLVIEPWLGNSMGMLHGGCTAMIAEAAALAAGEVEFGADAPIAVVDAHVRYLNGARVGPIVASATVIGREPEALSVRVAQHDAGLDRQTSLANVRVIRRAEPSARP